MQVQSINQAYQSLHTQTRETKPAWHSPGNGLGETTRSLSLGSCFSASFVWRLTRVFCTSHSFTSGGLSVCLVCDPPSQITRCSHSLFLPSSPLIVSHLIAHKMHTRTFSRDTCTQICPHTHTHTHSYSHLFTSSEKTGGARGTNF